MFIKDAQSGSWVFAQEIGKYKYLSRNFCQVGCTMIPIVLLLLALALALVAIVHLLNRERKKYSHFLDLLQSDFSGDPFRPALGNLSELLRNLESFYQEEARKRKLRLSIELPDSDLFYYFDTICLQRILKVLFFDTFFKTKPGGTIAFNFFAKREYVVVEIRQSIQIRRDDFTLLKQFIERYRGEFVLEKTVGLKQTLRVVLPIHAVPKRCTKSEAGIRKSDHTILVLSENATYLPFLKKELANRFRILSATNEAEAEQIALKELPNLMLIEMQSVDLSGIAACKRIKTHADIAFTPLVCVSSVNVPAETQLPWSQSGVDEFLSMPFNMDDLLLRIELLIEKQALNVMRSSTSARMIPSDIALSSMTDRLLHRALVCIERNMSNSDYSIFQLSQDLGMDRTVLYKKIHALSGLPPSEFMRSIRLKRAAQLLVQGGYPVATVSELVGFNTPKYFAKHFKDAYGVLPSKYALSLKTVTSATFKSDNNI